MRIFRKRKQKNRGRKDIVLYGAGGMGREIVVLIRAINSVKKRYNILGFVDDTRTGTVNGLPTLGDKTWLLAHKDSVVCACTVGYASVREKIITEMEAQGVTFETLVHPGVYIDPTVKIGAGTIIQSTCGISVNIEIGKGVFLNCGTNLGHDAMVGDFSVCFPRVQVSGGCRIGQCVTVGSMSFLYSGVSVGDGAVITPGSVVLKNVKENAYVMGNPAHTVEIG